MKRRKYHRQDLRQRGALTVALGIAIASGFLFESDAQEPLDDPFAATVEDGSAVDLLPQIGVLVESIQLDTEVATELVRAHAADADASSLREQVQQLIEAGSATEIDSSYVLTRPGERAKVESIQEFIYPTEYDPPGLPTSFDLQVDSAFFGQAFDVRNVGSTLEVEPSWCADEGVVTLNLVPERVQFANLISYGEGNLLAQQPVFFVMKAQTNLRVPDGGYSLVSVQVPRDEMATGEDAARLDQSKRVLVFVKATVFNVRSEGAEKRNDGDGD